MTFAMRLGSGVRAGLGAVLLLLAVGLGTRPAAAIEIVEVVSPGGIRAWLVEEHALPLVGVAFAFEGGAAENPDGRPGAALVLAAMLTEGAGDLDTTAFAERLDVLSVKLAFDLDQDYFLGTLLTLSANRDEAFDLLRLALAEPRFDAEPLERMRGELIAILRTMDQTPDTVARRILFEAAFPGHPYGRPMLGTPEGVAALTADDVRTYYRNVVTRDGLTIGVVGDIDAATLAAKLDDIFGALPAAGSRRPVADIVPALETPRIDIPVDLPQTVILAAGRQIDRRDLDFAPHTIASYIFGGAGFNSRLFAELRDRGLVYSPYAESVHLARSALEIVNAATRADRARETIAILEEMTARYAAEGPTDAEIAAAKRYLVGNYALQLDSTLAIARRLVSLQIDGLGTDYFDIRAGLFDAATPDAVRAAARRIFGGGVLFVTIGLPPQP